jgi:hypothetical protein
VMSSAASLWKLFRDQAERDSGIGLKLFGFIVESVFTIIPESCSDSSWNSVRNHPGIAFTFARIPHSLLVPPFLGSFRSFSVLSMLMQLVLPR